MKVKKNDLFNHETLLVQDVIYKEKFIESKRFYDLMNQVFLEKIKDPKKKIKGASDIVLSSVTTALLTFLLKKNKKLKKEDIKMMFLSEIDKDMGNASIYNIHDLIGF